jgi:F0F1-type ATP synthase assembly protein I
VAEFISAILTWGGIGWLLDRWLRTEPWFIVLGFVVGTAAGFYLMYLRSEGMVVRGTPPQEGRAADGGNISKDTT